MPRGAAHPWPRRSLIAVPSATVRWFAPSAMRMTAEEAEEQAAAAARAATHRARGRQASRTPRRRATRDSPRAAYWARALRCGTIPMPSSSTGRRTRRRLPSPSTFRTPVAAQAPWPPQPQERALRTPRQYCSNRSAAHAKLAQFDAALEDATAAALRPTWGKAHGRVGVAYLGQRREEGCGDHRFGRHTSRRARSCSRGRGRGRIE